MPMKQENLVKIFFYRQWVIGLSLGVAMAATRSHHVADLVHLPDASWAVFFLAGFYLGTTGIFATLFALAALVDFVAITWGGVSDFCVSPAYAFLLPAYAALFIAGRVYAARHRFTVKTLAPLLSSATVGTLACELVSSGGFYFFSGRFEQTSLLEFVDRFGNYFPGSLESMFFYLALTAALHATFATAARETRSLTKA